MISVRVTRYVLRVTCYALRVTRYALRVTSILYARFLQQRKFSVE